MWSQVAKAVLGFLSPLAFASLELQAINTTPSFNS